MRHVVWQEFHVSLRIPARLTPDADRAMHAAFRSLRFARRLRRLARSLFRVDPALRPVRVRVYR